MPDAGGPSSDQPTIFHTHPASPACAWRGKSVMMKSKPGTPEFALEYAKLMNGGTEKTVKRNFTALVKSYRASPKYTKLSARSKSDYDKILAWVVETLGPLPVAGLPGLAVFMLWPCGPWAISLARSAR